MKRVKVETNYYGCANLDCGYVGEWDSEHNTRQYHRLFKMNRNPNYVIPVHDCAPRYRGLILDNTKVIASVLASGRCPYCHSYVPVIRREELRDRDG